MTEARPAENAEVEAIRQIQQDLDATLFVEAGAGTGKTWALVERVLHLVLAGQRIDRIVAITFTEKAAAELRDRIRARLEMALVEHREHENEVRLALESLNRAQISTIHSFCQRLLYSFAAEAGVDPSFEIQDEIAAARRFQDRWRAYLESLAEDGASAAAVDRALGLGLTTRDLEQLARDLADRAELLPSFEESLPDAPAPDWGRLREWAEYVANVDTREIPETDPLRLAVEDLAKLLAELDSTGEEREAVLAAAAETLDQSLAKVGQQAVWGVRIKAVRQTCEEVREGLKELLEACRSEAIRDVMPLVTRFVREDASQRGREGLMTFDDLILRVRDLLQGDSNACRFLRQRYDVMLIDEFQDTDPLQVDIALAFATDPETNRLEPRRLFLVGDPKQSIYRFRRADMAVYSRAADAIRRAGGEFPLLQRSRRSRKPIIDWVNRVFERLIGDGGDPAIQPPYHSLKEVRPPDGLRGAGVAWFGGEVTDGSKARQIRAMECADVASYSRMIVEQGWEVWDKFDGKPRAASFKDIAVLIPSRTVLPALERALEQAAVPFRVEGGSLIYRTQEVRDLMNCLTAIDDPADEVAIVAALRSPAFACSDVDLGQFVAAGGRFNYLRDSGPDGPVRKGLRVLKRYHQMRHQVSLAALVEAFVAECGQIEVGFLHQGDRNSFRRARFIVEQARAFESSGPESLRALVQWLERRANQVMLDYEGAGLDDDEDSVRVLTIHGAKGLEFPIVILAGTATAPNTRLSSSYLVDRTRDRAGVRIGSKSRRFALGAVDDLEAMEKQHIEAEFVRLLYVAATRARDHLLVSLYRKQVQSKAAAALLGQAGAADGVPSLPRPSSSPQAGRSPLAGLEVDPPAVRTSEELMEARRRLVEGSHTRRYTSATRLGRLEDKDSTDDDTEPWARGRAGTRLGRAVHAAIQSLPLEPDEGLIRAFSRAQAVAEAVPERAPEVERLVRAALASDAAARARAARRALREVPFAVALDGVTIEGFIDLLIDDGDGLEIVDWKTDAVPADQIGARLAEYRLQAGLYVLGIERACQRPVRRVTYVFVSPEREESPGDPRELADAARAEVLARHSA